jgi:proteasome lid subunit RPN8/RPN11
MQNSREDSPERRYLIAPEDMLDAEKEARRLGIDIIGVYHSHPDHPARPSEFDREHAFPWYSYVIVSVQKGEPENLTAWVLKDDRSSFDHEDLRTL